MRLRNLRGKKILILGYGREGRAAFKFLRRLYPLTKIGIADQKEGENYLNKQKDYDIAIKSPGIPKGALKIPYTTATNIFFAAMPKSAAVVGITGTKGKSTTSTLVYKIFKKAGFDAFLAGNIGNPALNILPKLKKNSVVVLELSSFQLQDFQFPVSVSCILNVFPEHLDHHKNFEEYIEAKINIIKFQRRCDKIFFFKENLPEEIYKKINKSPAEKELVDVKNFKLFSREDLKIKGEHNFKNAVMAAKVAENFEISPFVIRRVITSFKGLEHRLEFVRKIKGVSFYNDSASTNPQAAVAAIKSFSEAKILIAGGKDKNLDYTPFINDLKKSSIKKIVFFGENKEKVERFLKGKYSCDLCDTLEGAVGTAFNSADKGDIILFSPAAASFDMFKDYAERGKVFKRIVRSI
jgi:UDP-N-acetylmuramoylalanine--D-glutamate ligase